jgi:hypothetical protein
MLAIRVVSVANVGNPYQIQIIILLGQHPDVKRIPFTPASERGISSKVHVRNCAIKTFQFSALSRKIRKLLNTSI